MARDEDNDDKDNGEGSPKANSSKNGVDKGERAKKPATDGDGESTSKPKAGGDKKAAKKASGEAPADAKKKAAKHADATKAAREADAHHGKGGHAAVAHAAGHHAPDRKEYWKIFGVLFVLTVLEVVVAQIPGIGKGTLAILLIGMALAKAAFVGLFYMHLKHETKQLRAWVALPFAAPAVYALVLIAEAAWRLTR